MIKRDLVLIGSIVALVAILLLGVTFLKQDGDYVVVRVDGKEVARYDLAKDGEYELNGGTNILRIENGKAYLTHANCPDMLCVKQGKIDESGETITCLPNRLTVTVYTQKGSEIDIIN